MPLILAIETATPCGSVALIKDHQLVGSQFYKLEKSHSSLLHVMTKQLMENAQMDFSDIDAVAISEGPGSYTGLRIGVSAAKGLCYSLDVPLISVNSLEGMAYQVRRYHPEGYYFCPMMDARRMEVYTSLFDERFNLVKETEPVILDEGYLKTELTENRILFFGDGALKFKTVVSDNHAVFLDEVFPSAEEIGLLGAKKFDESKFENVVSFEPFYLKEFRIIPSKK